MLSLPKTIVGLTLISILSLMLISPTAGQGPRRHAHVHAHARGNYVVGSFAPVAAVYRPGNFTRMFASANYHAYPYRLPYFPRYATPGFFQSYYRPATNYFDPVLSARVISLNRVVVGTDVSTRLAISEYDASRSAAYASSRTRAVVKTHASEKLYADIKLTRPDSRGLKLGAAGAATASGNLISTKHDAADYQRLAEKEFRDGDFFEALRHVNHGLIEDHDNGKLYLFAAHASLASGDYRGAVTQLEAAITLLDQNNWDYVIRNRFEAFNRVTYQDGIDSLLEYSARNPNSVDALLLKGFHLGCLGNLEQSQIELTTALSLDPGNALVHRLLSALKLPTVMSAVSTDFPVEPRFEIAPGPRNLDHSNFDNSILDGPNLDTTDDVDEIELLPMPTIIEEEEIEAIPIGPENQDEDWLDLDPSLEPIPELKSVLQLDES